MFNHRRMVLTGVAVLLVSVGSFAAWLTLAPLTSAAIAPGIVKVAGERQSVQHLEGGIIREILVDEGEHVREGQVLMRLDPTQRRAAKTALTGRLINLEATAARLRAERDDVETLTFPDSLEERAEEFPDDDILTGERRVFQSRLEALKGQRRILDQRKARFRDEIQAYQSQLRASQDQLGYINEELEAATIIYEKGLYEKPRYLSLKRSVARLEGEIGELKALKARTHQRIGETDLEVIALENEWTSRAAAELQAVTADILNVREQIGSAVDVLDRLEITAPMSGAVVGLRFHTVGGVIGSGEQILDIVPSNASLVIEARIRTDDIDVVGPGLECDVQLSAYSLRSTPPLPGVVKQVSADSFVEEASGRSYYKALVEVDDEALAALSNVSLYPGMPAEVFIKTGRRSAMQYLLEPVTRSLRRSLRE